MSASGKCSARVALEIGGRGRFASSTDGGKPLDVAAQIGVVGIEHGQRRFRQPALGGARPGQPVEHPGTFRDALHQPRFGQQFEVAAHPRLALA
jgi:hypothetical protein